MLENNSLTFLANGKCWKLAVFAGRSLGADLEHSSFSRERVQKRSDFKPFSAIKDQKKIKGKMDTDLCATCERRPPARRPTTSALAASTDPTFDSWLAVFELELPSYLRSAPGGSPFSLPSGLECRTQCS
jgi:hypothetical protein